MSEAVMMALGPTLGHERAHQLVLTASRQAAIDGTSMRDALHAVPQIAAHLSLDDLERLLDPTTYAGLATASVDAVVSRVDGER
jgi:3-carboxy-cis,cis-muconate cycloisomerase